MLPNPFPQEWYVVFQEGSLHPLVVCRVSAAELTDMAQRPWDQDGGWDCHYGRPNRCTVLEEGRNKAFQAAPRGQLGTISVTCCSGSSLSKLHVTRCA